MFQCSAPTMNQPVMVVGGILLQHRKATGGNIRKRKPLDLRVSLFLIRNLVFQLLKKNKTKARYLSLIYKGARTQV